MLFTNLINENMQLKQQKPFFSVYGDKYLSGDGQEKGFLFKKNSNKR